MNNKEFLKALSETASSIGRENLLLPVVTKYFQPFGEITKGDFNNIYMHKKGSGLKNIMLMAHSDEIFLRVTGFCDRGFLKFKAEGINPKTLVSQEVYIHGKEKIAGIIEIKPSHLLKKDERGKIIDINNLFIDTGYTTEQLVAIVSIGDHVTMKGEFYELLNNNVTSKVVGDRVGIVVMYKCAKYLAKIKLKSEVYFVCSTQEEVRNKEAMTACFGLNADISIFIDVTFDSGNFETKYGENKLGAGPVISVGPNIHPRLRQHIIDTARFYNVPYQIELEHGNMVEETLNVKVSELGVPTLLISIPIKYMNTAMEVANMEDIKNTAKLIAKFIEKIDREELEGVLCF